MADLFEVYGNGDNGLGGAVQPPRDPFKMTDYNQGKDDNNTMKHAGEPSKDETLAKLADKIEKEKEKKKMIEQLKQLKNNDSIIDKYNKRSKDITKILVITIIGMAILSSHDMVVTYLRKYINKNELDSRNEMFVRASVPLTLLFVVWTIKAFGKD